MTDGEILTAIAVIARDKLDHEGEVSPSTRLAEDLELDSLRMMTLAVEVEDRFCISLDEDDEVAITTVGDLVRTIREKLTAGPRD